MTVGKHITRAAIAALVLLAAVLQMTRNVIVATFGAVVFGA
ncbi:MAG: hypothetical protein QOF21_389, partial [Actinomycetota bacterium]